MPIVADASVAIRGDISKFSGDLKKAEGQTKGLGAKLKGALSPGMLLGAAGGALAVTAVVDVLGNAVEAASNFGETLSKVNAIFGEESMPALEKWADTAAEALGVGKQSALDAAATFATFGKSAGLAGDELVGFSTDLTGLAADLGSFYNTSPEDAIMAIGAALRGESEPIRRYGVLLDDATLRQRALSMGIIETTKSALTPQQKVLAAQAEIFAQTSDAQGDFARTSGGLAGQQKILAAKLADINIEIGEKLLPIMVQLTTWVVNDLIPAFEAALPVIVETTKIALIPLIKTIELVTLAIKTVITAATDMALNFGDMGNKVHAVADDLGEDFQTVKDIVRNNMVEMGMSFEDAVIAAESELQGLPQIAEDAAFETARRFTRGVVNAAPMVAQGVEEGIVEPVEEKSDRAIEQATNAARALTTAYAGELAQGANEVQAGWDALLSGAEEEQTKAQRIASINAKLISQELTDALRSEDPYLRQQAIAYRGTLEEELEKLSSNAIYQAYITGTSVATAIRDNHADAAAAAQGLRRGVIAGLRFNAYEIGQTGGESWVKGVADGISDEQWRVSQKVDDILDYLLLAGSPPFTKAKEAAEGVAKTYMSTLSKGLQDSRLGALAGNLLPSSSSASFGFGMASQTTGTAGRAITVIVKDAGVAASVGDIARGLREFEDTGMLP